MISTHTQFEPRLVLLVVFLLGLGGAFSGPVHGATIAEVDNMGDSLIFYPVVEFARLVLDVTGPCDFEYRQVVTPSQAPVFSLDATTIDGAYTYQLVREEAVDPDVVTVLEQARVENDLEAPKALCREGKLPAPPLAQSEGFRVLGGQIIFDPDASEAAVYRPDPDTLRSSQVVGVSSADFVINDDLIVDGSACVGFDCVNGESFGFDTLRLKEHNLRIKFDDTSVASSFSRNDWQLTANEAGNGGASKFSIDDISGSRTPFTVEAGANDHTLYVDDNGRIGNRTATPIVELHTASGDTPTLRLEQDGSRGFDAQTWEVAGNELDFFVADATSGMKPLRILVGAPTSSIHVSADGDVGIGTSSPTVKLEVAGALTVNGGFRASSSREIKDDYQPVDRRALLDKLRSLPIQTWVYKADDGRAKHMGPFAEDFYDAFGFGPENKHIDLGDATGVTLAAVQGLLAMLDGRDRELADLRERVSEMEQALERGSKRTRRKKPRGHPRNSKRPAGPELTATR